MQPQDQDELRRKAQEVLARRIPLESAPPAEPPSTPAPPRRPRQGRSRAPRPEPQRPERVDPPPSPRHPALEVETIQIEPVEVLEEEYAPPEIEEPMARTERRRYDDEETQPEPVTRRQRMASGRQARIRRALNDRDAVRQAILLNEILGKPVSLREREGSGTFGGI